MTDVIVAMLSVIIIILIIIACIFLLIGIKISVTLDESNARLDSIIRLLESREVEE